jgi:hypothetical protein
MTFVRLKTFILLMSVILPSYAYGQRELALNQPIVEGTSMIGIKLGDSEGDVFKSLGFPDQIDSNFENPSQQHRLKFLLYGLDKNSVLFVFTKDEKVEVIQLIWSGEGIPVYKGKTAEGLALGTPMERVKKNYGECEMSKGICWDPKRGISIGGDKVVSFILIAKPEKELPDYLK